MMIIPSSRPVLSRSSQALPVTSVAIELQPPWKLLAPLGRPRPVAALTRSRPGDHVDLMDSSRRPQSPVSGTQSRRPRLSTTVLSMRLDRLRCLLSRMVVRAHAPAMFQRSLSNRDASSPSISREFRAQRIDKVPGSRRASGPCPLPAESGASPRLPAESGDCLRGSSRRFTSRRRSTRPLLHAHSPSSPLLSCRSSLLQDPARRVGSRPPPGPYRAEANTPPSILAAADH